MGKHHFNRLFESNEGHVQFVDAIVERVEIVRNLHLRLRGSLLDTPPDMSTDMRRFMTLLDRYSQGDMRHSRAELQACRTIAQWTVDINCELRNQPRKEVQWIDEQNFRS